MNFDMNMLSTLMHLMSAQKPPRKETRQQEYPNESERYDSRRGSSGEWRSQSVFAMQNGLGAKVEINEHKESQGGYSQNASSSYYAPKSSGAGASNPMAAILEMMTGKPSGGNGDMMSSLMPMLMNMMNGRNAKGMQNGSSSMVETPTNNANVNNSNANNNNVNNNNENINAKEQTRKSADESVLKKGEDGSQTGGAKTKTQPRRKDMYEPIAFAGYTLISALNKLYIAKRA